MATKSSTDKETMSSREMELMAHALKSIKGDFVVDYDKLAELAGFKNKVVASVTWNRLRRKLDRINSDTTKGPKLSDISGPEDSPAPTKKAAGKKRKPTTDEDLESQLSKASGGRRKKLGCIKPMPSDDTETLKAYESGQEDRKGD